MTPLAVIITMVCYFGLMYLVSWASTRGNSGFSGGHNTNWLVISIAMIGSAISGVTFVSVPGMVDTTGFGYLQMCLGFLAGYIVIAFVLTPIYFKYNLVSVYGYLQQRFGMASYKTGAWFFFISKMLGAAVRLYLVCVVLQLLVFGPLGIPFWANVLVNVAIVLAYTFKGGVKAVIGNDVLKTVCMVAAVVLCIVFIAKELAISNIAAAVSGSGMSKIFWFEDANHPEFFWKQFLGGMFTVIAMTGLDQDMMQRTLASKNVGDSKKNLILSSLLQIVVIFLFLVLGVLLYQYAAAEGISARGDQLFGAVATSAGMPMIVGVMFVAGLVACAYSAGGSALTALTTSFSMDILGIQVDASASEQAKKRRQRVHVCMAVLMAVVIFVFSLLNNTSTIDAVYKVASYTYGPLLGLFAFGIFVKREVRDRWVPLVAIVSPVLCLIINLNSARWFGGYKFSYELLIMNAAFTFIGLCMLIKPKKS